MRHKRIHTDRFKKVCYLTIELSPQSPAEEVAIDNMKRYRATEQDKQLIDAYVRTISVPGFVVTTARLFEDNQMVLTARPAKWLEC